MSKRRNRFVAQIMAVIISASMVLLDTTVFAAVNDMENAAQINVETENAATENVNNAEREKADSVSESHSQDNSSDEGSVMSEESATDTQTVGDKTSESEEMNSEEVSGGENASEDTLTDEKVTEEETEEITTEEDGATEEITAEEDSATAEITTEEDSVTEETSTEEEPPTEQNTSSVENVLSYQAQEYIFDVSEMGVIKSIPDLVKEGKTGYTSQDGYFTVYYGTEGKNEAKADKGFADGYVSKGRLSLGPASVTPGNVKGAIGFTITQDEAKVKLWWRGAKAGRQVAVFDESGTIIEKTDEPYDANMRVITTFKLAKAGTYYIGNVGGNNWFYQMQVRDGKDAEKTEWSKVSKPKVQSAVQNGGNIDVSVEAVVDETEGMDILKIEMYDSDKKLVDVKESAKATKEITTISFTPNTSGSYTFIAKGYRDGEQSVLESEESIPVNFILPLKAPSSFSGRNIGNGNIEIGYGEVPEADSYVISAVEAKETTDAEGNKIYQPCEGAEPVSLESNALKVTFKGLKLETNYIFKAYAVRKGTGEDKKDENGPVSADFIYKVLDRSEYAWTWRTFGQSTSDKYNGYEGNANDGEVRVWSGMNPKESPDGKMHQSGKLASDGHMGISYYYTQLDKDTNFVLEATATVNSWYYNGGESFGLMVADAVGEHGDTSVYYDNLYAVGTADVKYWWNGSAVDPEDNYSEDDARYRMSNGMASIVRKGVTAGWNEGGASAPPGLIKATTTLENSAALKGGAGTYNIIGNYTDSNGEFGGAAPNSGTNIEPLMTRFRLRLEKNNTGYFMTYIDPDGKEHTDIWYDEAIYTHDYANNTLLQIDKDNIYVGFMATREMNATFSDIRLTTSRVEDDAPPMEKPKTYYSAAYNVTSASLTNKPEYEVIFMSNWEGTLSIKDAAGRELVNKDYYKYLSETMTAFLDKNTGSYKEISYLEKCFDVGEKGDDGRYSNVTYDADGNIISAKVRAGNTKISVPVNEALNSESLLCVGTNKFTVSFIPDRNWHMNGDKNSLLTDYGRWEYELNVTFRKYGIEGNNIYVAPAETNSKADSENIVRGNAGKPTGDGTKAAPLDIYTAIKYVQPGQTIVLAKGRYSLKKGIVIEKGINGREDAPIYMVAEPGSYDRTQPFKTGGVVLDFNGITSGMTLCGNYWYLKGFDITNTADGQKGLQISGSYNVIDQINTYNNGNTGVQIARGNGADNDISDWPSYNTVKNCTSYNNADSKYEDADGFAAKLTIGMGNVFDGCISAYNADDGWDLYAKGVSGPIGQVVIKNCAAFRNGWVLKDEKGMLDICNGVPVGSGNGNGFKLGGESISGHHILLNSYAFENKAKGIDNNSCPDIQAYNSISFNNEGSNVSLAVKSASPNTDFRMRNVISYRTEGDTKDSYSSAGTQNSEYYLNDTVYLDGKNRSGKEVNAAWFESSEFTFNITDKDGSQGVDSTITRNSDGTIKMNGGFLQFTQSGMEQAGFINLKKETIHANVGEVIVYMPVTDDSEGDVSGGAIIGGTGSADIGVDSDKDTTGETLRVDDEIEKAARWSDAELSIINPEAGKITIILDSDKAALDEKGNYHVEYTGAAIKPGVRVAMGNGKGTIPSEVDAGSFTVIYKNNQRAYTFSPLDEGFDSKKAPSIILKGRGNYSGTYTVNFIIDRIKLDDTGKVANTGLVTVETGKKVALPRLMYNGRALSTKEYNYGNAEIKDSKGNKVNEIRERGEYTVTYKALEVNFTGEVQSVIKVLGSDSVSGMTNISRLRVRNIPNVMYNGKSHTPEIIFGDGTAAGSVCDVQYVGNINAGTASVILNGKIDKNFYGTRTLTFKIVAKPLNLNEYSVSARYNGKEIVFDRQNKNLKEPLNSMGSGVSFNGVQVWAGKPQEGVLLKEGIDYTLGYTGTKRAGTANLVIRGIGNYKGSMKSAFKIAAYDINSADISVQISDQLYTKGFKAPAVILKRGDMVISSDNYTVSCTVKALGSSKATITGKNLLKGKRADIPFKIVEKDMSAVKINAPDVFNGGGVRKKGDKIPYTTKVTVLDNDKKMTLNRDYTLEFYSSDQFDEALFDHVSGIAYIRNSDGAKVTATPLGVRDKVDFAEKNQTIYVVAKAVSGSGYKGAEYGSYKLVSSNTINNLKVERLTAPIVYKEGEPSNVLIGRIMGQYVSEGKLKIRNKKISDKGDYVNEDGFTALTKNDFEIDYGRSGFRNGKATIIIQGKGSYAGTKKITVRVEPFNLGLW